MQNTEVTCSARVDLAGGTLDFPPIHRILKNVVTLNVALSLKSKVLISEKSIQRQQIEIISRDYQTHTIILQEDWEKEKTGQLALMVQILDQFPIFENKKTGLIVELSSSIPPGSGLGGSSVMAITLCKALVEYYSPSTSSQSTWTQEKILDIVSGIESKVLDCGPTGYQDYYPALYGGILALHPSAYRTQVEQLFTPQLKNYLEKHITLVYSNQSRFSGINNWEVYKAFFDKDPAVRSGLQELANVANEVYQNIKNQKFENIIDLLAQEGNVRKKLFKDIVTPPMENFVEELKNKMSAYRGMKICGAGGGGCFILLHDDLDTNPNQITNKNQRKILEETIQSHGMKKLSFEIQT